MGKNNKSSKNPLEGVTYDVTLTFHGNIPNYTEWRQHMQRWLMQYRSVCRYDFKARRVDYGMHPRWEVTYRFDKKEIAALFKLSWSGVDTAVAFV